MALSMVIPAFHHAGFEAAADADEDAGEAGTWAPDEGI
jgi:hypothetical protein